jgi:rare lipoprotein A
MAADACPADRARRTPGRRRSAAAVAAVALGVAGCSLFRGGRGETGTASWYGPGLDGGRTANGERFDAMELTAAHRSLPLGSRARVTNLENGRSVVVRINDRGPATRGRVLDVSYAAARALGMLRGGTARVRIEPLDGPGRAERGRGRLRRAGRVR